MESKDSSAGHLAFSRTPTRSRPVSARARVRSAKRIRGRVTRGAHTSVYSARADSSAGRERITSPIAPGRIRRRRMILLNDVDGDRDVDGLARQTQTVRAGLVSE